jgi:hypothetical protein
MCYTLHADKKAQRGAERAKCIEHGAWGEKIDLRIEKLDPMRPALCAMQSDKGKSEKLNIIGKLICKRYESVNKHSRQPGDVFRR